MSLDKKNKIPHRIENEIGVPNLSNILADRITPTDLQSLLLSVYQKRASSRKPRDILLDYKANKFMAPSHADPLLLLEWDYVAFSHLPNNFASIELSPVAPLGCVSSVAPISQDWILTTIRNMELISDTTNVLALECALRRQNLLRDNGTKRKEVHLACSHRVVRSQRYESSNLFQHFRLFSLCSAGRTTGNLNFELETIQSHVRFYLDAMRSFLGDGVTFRVVLLDMSPDSKNLSILSDFMSKMNKRLGGEKVRFEIVSNEKNEYYQDVRFNINCAQMDKREYELVDGGIVDWTQKFLNNSKERLIISGIGSERLCEMRTKLDKFCI
jgi:hypothetical protein